MMLSPAYEKARQQAVQEGVQEGILQGIAKSQPEALQAGLQAGLQQGRLEMVKQLLKTKYEVVDETLLQVVDPLAKMSPEQSIYSLTHLSREELLAQFGK